MFKKIKKWIKYKIAIFRINSLADEIGVVLSEWQYDYLFSDIPFPPHCERERGIGKTTTIMLKLFYKTAYESKSVSPKVVWEILNDDPDFKATCKGVDLYKNYYYNLLDKTNNRKVFSNRLKANFWRKLYSFTTKSN